ncbi:MAG: hypothetical protein PHI86_00720 [Candidatus Omnitrophica bacterium]|nr:hypothetical protein [Candidatus Omnitrophota bacterium]
MQLKKIHYNDIFWIDIFCIFGIGLFCLLYSLFANNFAKLNIRFEFVNFPIFIGEILLGTCFILLTYKTTKLKAKLGIWHYLFLAFLGFIVLKALSGYYKWGALSFRSAALFYYTIFAIFSYYFYNKNIFEKISIKLAILILLTTLASLAYPSLYFQFIYYILILAIYISFEYRFLKLVGLIIFIYFIFIGNLFNQTKGMFISLWVSIIYLLFIVYPLLIIKIKNWKFKSFSYLAPFIILLLIFNFLVNEKMHKRIQIWANIKGTINDFMVFNKELHSARTLYKPKDSNIKLYSEYRIPDEKSSVSIPKQLVGIVYETIELPIDYYKEKIKKVDNQSQQTVISRSGGQDEYNILWRMFVWRDMVSEVYHDKIILGEDFGKPFRSVSLETSNQLSGIGWHTGSDVGWLEPHNSYIHILYRAGIMGLLFIIFIWGLFIKLTIDFITRRDFIGLLLSSALLFWLVLANFIVFLELPYFAIPFWSLFGLTLAYCYKDR